MTNYPKCPECGNTMHPWEYDRNAGWSCDSCGYQEEDVWGEDE